jgi:hypothetical protein
MHGKHLVVKARMVIRNDNTQSTAIAYDSSGWRSYDSLLCMEGLSTQIMIIIRMMQGLPTNHRYDTSIETQFYGVCQQGNYIRY